MGKISVEISRSASSSRYINERAIEKDVRQRGPLSSLDIGQAFALPSRLLWPPLNNWQTEEERKGEGIGESVLLTRRNEID